jgi:hypothetical protein
MVREKRFMLCLVKLRVMMLRLMGLSSKDGRSSDSDLLTIPKSKAQELDCIGLRYS